MSDDEDIDALRRKVRELERERRILRGQLERSEDNRRRLESFKDRHDTFMQQVIHELHTAKEATQAANARLEARVDERTRELVAANEALVRARDAALAASRAKTSFLTVMSHELRTPLNAVIGFSEIVIEEIDDGTIEPQQVREDIGRVLAQAQHLLNLIDDVLDLSRVEAGASTVRYELVPLRVLVRDVEQTIRPLARRRDNQLCIDLSEAPGQFASDRTKLRQILYNLLSNAAKFTEGGRIDVRVRALGDVVEIAIADTGIGIEPEAMARLFQPFALGDGSTTRRFGGSGLGLSLARAFCHLLGGDIDVASEPGRGATFTVTLPRVAPRVPALTELAEGPAPAFPTRGTAVVLDEDRDAHVQLARLLARIGLDATATADGDEALALVARLAPRLVVVDVLRGDGRGMELLQRLATSTSAPVIVLSQLHEDGRCRALGAAACLQRPTEPEALRSAIAACTTRHDAKSRA